MEKHRESNNSITQYYKRKTQDTSFEDKNAFARSKKVERSPTRRGKEENMEELTKMMVTITKQLERISQDNKEIKQEIKELKDEMQRKEERWQQYVENLEIKIEKLERKLEIKEKRERKNNIVIKGLTLREEDGKKAVEEFLATELKVEANLKNFRRVGKERKIIIASMESWDMKREVMERKNKLGTNTKTSKIFIENDLTEEEWNIQRQIKETAYQCKIDGKKVKLGYQKLQIDGKWWFWDNNSKKLTETKN